MGIALYERSVRGDPRLTEQENGVRSLNFDLRRKIWAGLS